VRSFKSLAIAGLLVFSGGFAATGFMDLLNVSGIYKQQQEGFLLRNISFTQQRLQKIAIAGATGSGKSTLMKVIAGLVQPDEGFVLFNGEKVKGPHEKLIPGHPGIAYLSQHFELRNHHRMEELLAYANDLTDAASAELYKVCRIDHLLKRRTDQLSGGEKQRVALAVLLTRLPSLLLLDEPFSNLDMIHKGILKSVINDVSERLGTTCMLISHDPQDVLSWADDILVLKDGALVQQGPPEMVYRQPTDIYTAGLFGKYNLISPTEASALEHAEGMVQKNKMIMARPEDLKLVNNPSDALAGTLTAVNFIGSAYEAEVTLPGSKLTVRTNKRNLTIGDTVYVSLSSGEVWYV